MSNTLANLRLGQKLIIPAVVVMMALSAILWTAWSGLISLRHEADEAIQVTALRLSNVSEAAKHLNGATIAEKNAIIAENEAAARKAAEELKNEIADAKGHIAALEKLAATSAQRDSAKKIDAAIQAYDTLASRVAAHAIAGEDQAAVRLSGGEGRQVRLDVMGLVEGRTKVYMNELEQSGIDIDTHADAILRNIMLAGGIGAILAFAIAAFVVVGQVTRPMGSAMMSLEQLAKGDLDVEIAGTERKDEVGTLARGLLTFKDNAKEMRRLQDEQRAAEAKRLEDERAAEARAQAERKHAMAQLADRLESAVMGVVQGVSSASAQMQATATLMTRSAEEASQQSSSVAAASEEATTNVQTAAAAAEELTASISEINRQVAQSSGVALKAVEKAKTTNATVKSLAETAQKVGEVVNLINSIASQTNLLALNATIEAARAGDAGKGFAVVASEVKALANQTAKATEEISSQIAAIQGETETAVRAIEDIGTTIAEISEISTTIASAVEEQGAATSEIARNVQQAATGTKEVSANIAGVSQASGAVGKSAGEVLSAAESMSEQSTTLKSEVDRFLKEIRAA